MNELKRLAARADPGALSAAFLEAAREEGLVDVAVGALDSPIGRLTVAVTPRGLVRVIFESEDVERELDEIARAVSPRVLAADAMTDEVRRELDEYFAGERHRFALKLDRRLMTPFARDVLSATAKVAYGRVATYGEIAGRIGRPTASRA
ncbi:MAG TPA: MGMT family protein, partial [Actinomycetota bacterium]